MLGHNVAKSSIKDSSTSINAVRHSAVMQFNIYLASEHNKTSTRSKNFDELTDDELCSKEILQCFGFWLTYYAKTRRGDALEPGTAVGYMSGVKNSAMIKFKEHLLWTEDETWYTLILQDMFAYGNLQTWKWERSHRHVVGSFYFVLPKPLLSLIIYRKS